MANSGGSSGMTHLMSLWLYLALFAYTTCSPGFSNNSKTHDLDMLDEVLKYYDRRALPTSREGVPTVVTCSIFIRSFGSINPSTMDYEVDLYLRQTWYDHRLKQLNLGTSLDLNDPALVKRIWKPEVFFANAKHAEFQYVTVPNVLVRIMPGGNLLYMLRLKLRFSCMMDLYRYPMDSQVCTIELESFSKTKDELNLRWTEEHPVMLYDNLKLPQFEIERVNTTLCREKFHTVNLFFMGEYSCLRAEFYLRRSVGYHLVQSYLPTILIVVISWVSFWLDVNAIPARITLGVTTLLTISSKGAGIQSNLPPVSYVKAMDVWMGACTTFVFAALLEFTLVNYMWRKRPETLSGSSMPNIITVKSSKAVADNEKGDPTNASAPVQTTARFDTKLHAKRIDKLSRVVFPALFLGFNIVYWLYFMC
uniref:Cys-loop ligand-gated ion channel subunit n=1 Tax=Pardosa pseudoannulata TaxID=330961 RepID=A0AA51UA74_9ARAC|nr:cys-loop ligand-gated ion channel subunit [Pardosa pseudoannulata]